MSKDEITVQALGCGDAFSSGGRLNACFYVKAPGFSFLVDCGATALAALKRYGISSAEPDCIFISHFHGDHFGGLPFFLLDAAMISRRSKPLEIITPPGGEKKIKELVQLLYPGSWTALHALKIRFREFEAGKKLHAGPVLLEAFAVKHTPAAKPHGLRICLNNKILAYSGDTEWTDELIPLSAGADLFICECCFYEKDVKGHLSYHKLMEKRSQLSCKKLMLTHMDSDMLDHLEKVKLDQAEEGRIYAL